MGTRSLTIFKDGKTELAVMYRQFDGYPEVHGKELAEFLESMAIVNGICSDQPIKKANGMGCLAAQVIAHFKTSGPGNIYLYPAKSRNVWEEYRYIITGKAGNREPTIQCQHDDFKDDKSHWVTVFKGRATEMLAWIGNKSCSLVD